MKGGRVELIMGPMYCGKTSELFRRRRRHIVCGQSVLVVKSKNDVRYSTEEEAASHNFDFVKAIARDTLDPADPIYAQYDVICIDEAQFYSNLIPFCETLNKIVILTALSSDFRREPFLNIAQLIPKCDRVDMLYSICTLCHDDGAAFTRRIATATISNGTNVDIGGIEKFVAVCRSCYFKRYIDTDKLEIHRQAMVEIRSSK